MKTETCLWVAVLGLVLAVIVLGGWNFSLERRMNVTEKRMNVTEQQQGNLKQTVDHNALWYKSQREEDLEKFKEELGKRTRQDK